MLAVPSCAPLAAVVGLKGVALVLKQRGRRWQQCCDLVHRRLTDHLMGNQKPASVPAVQVC